MDPVAVDLPADTMRDVNLPLLPASVMISGRVTDIAVVGVANATVSAFTAEVTGALNSRFVNSTKTDVNGNYSFRVLNGTNYTLVFAPPRPAP